MKCAYARQYGMEKKLTLQIDHINGNNRDHNITNLRILCPNCHSQTENWCGRKEKTKEFYSIPINELSKLVFEKTLDELSKRFNISGGIIARRCDRLGIKRPDAKYWNLKKTDIEVKNKIL